MYKKRKEIRFTPSTLQCKVHKLSQPRGLSSRGFRNSSPMCIHQCLWMALVIFSFLFHPFQSSVHYYCVVCPVSCC